MKKLLIAVFASTALFSLQAQDDVARVKAIADAITVNCGAPIWGQDSLKAVTNYSLYREFKKQGDNQPELETKLKYYKDTYAGWKYVFINAPSARESTQFDALDIYTAFAEATTDETLKSSYLDSALAVYDIRIHCFGETADLQRRKANAWYYNKSKGNEAFIFDLFNKTIEAYDKEAGNSRYKITPSFLSSWMIMAIKAHKVAKVVEEEAVFLVYDQINDIIEKNENSSNADAYAKAGESVFQSMDQNGYLNPAKIAEIAEKKYAANPDDFANVLKVYNLLKSVKLYDNKIFTEVAEKVYAQQPSSSLALFLAQKAADSDNYSKAIQYIQDANETETDASAKAKNFYTIAQFYQKKGDFSSARTYANKAADMKPGWGQPYILIGYLYAGSGSKCGEGTGFESQTVVWAAIDVWNKAKSIDPSVAGEAQTLINRYAQYMPTVQDIMMRNLSVGSPYSIGCWIGVSTTIRTSN
jgi:tetratricopeptide (TPR) repeat protein